MAAVIGHSSTEPPAERKEYLSCARLLLRKGATWDPQYFDLFKAPEHLREKTNTYYTEINQLLRLERLAHLPFQKIKDIYQVALFFRDYPVILKLVNCWKEHDEKEREKLSNCLASDEERESKLKEFETKCQLKRLSVWADDEGRNALMLACEDNEGEFAEKLKTAGADVNVKDLKGHKASWYAAKNGNETLTLTLWNAEKQPGEDAMEAASTSNPRLAVELILQKRDETSLAKG